MKQILLIGFFVVFCLKSYSKIIFENGHFIDENDQTVQCLIKNIDWMHNPTEFDYKLSEDGPVKTADIKTVKEFEIIGVSKYVRAEVEIDRASDDLNKMDTERNPIFQEETLFLKVLIEGEASLYKYSSLDLTRFFYNTGDSEISQLVYKRYLTDDNDIATFDNHIAQNNLFRQQLYTDLKCEGITLNDFERIKYNKRSLEKFFVNYNECSGGGFVNFDPIEKRDLFNLSIRPGLDFSNLVFRSHTYDIDDIDFGNKINYRLGIELEIILPFHKNKWSLIVEPTYQYFETEKISEVDYVVGGILVSKANYRSIELPIGIRHSFYVNDNSKIFLNAAYIYDYNENSTVGFTREDGSQLRKPYVIHSSPNFALGVGYKYKERLNVEIRYQTTRDIITGSAQWGAEYQKTSLMVGFSLF